MKYSIIIGFFALLAFAGMSCEKESNCLEQETYFIVFGHFYGECVGEGCVEIYKVADNKLYEETTNQYPGDEFYKFQEFEVLSDAKYQLVKDLENDVPEELWNETQTVLGIPDGGDWGGAYFEISSTRGHRYFLLDQNESNMNAVYNAFVDRINEKIAIINQ